MRLLYLILGLAVLAWVIYTYQGSSPEIKVEENKTVQQQYQESIDEAKEAAAGLQKMLDEQEKRLQQTTE